MSTTKGKPPSKVAESIARLDDLTSGRMPIGRNGRPKTSRYRGVSFKARRSRPWEASILRQKGAPKAVIGYFGDEDEAARAWDRAAIACGRPREQLNFPDEADVRVADPPRSPLASEAETIAAIAAALGGLDVTACRRVLWYVLGHFGEGGR